MAHQPVDLFGQHRPHGGRHDGTAPIAGDGDAHSAQLFCEVTELRLPLRSVGEAERIAGIASATDVEPTRGVANAARHATGVHREIPELCMRSARDASIGGLESEQSGESGRDANRSTTVSGGGQGDEATRYCGCTAARRTTRSATVLPRVVRRSVQHRARDVHAAEFTGGRETGEHGTGAFEALHHHRRVGGLAVGEHHTGLGVGPALHLIEFLHTDG